MSAGTVVSLFDFFNQQFARSSGLSVFNGVGHFPGRRFGRGGDHGFYLRLGGDYGFYFRLRSNDRFDFRLSDNLSVGNDFLIDDRFFFIADGRCGFRFVNRGVSGFLIDDFNRFTGLSDNRCATVAAVGADNDGSRDGRGSRGLNVCLLYTSDAADEL